MLYLLRFNISYRFFKNTVDKKIVCKNLNNLRLIFKVLISKNNLILFNSKNSTNQSFLTSIATF